MKKAHVWLITAFLLIPFVAIPLVEIMHLRAIAFRATADQRAITESIADSQEAYNCIKNGRFRSALQFARESVRICPDHSWGYVPLGVALSQLGDHREAVVQLTRTNSAEWFMSSRGIPLRNLYLGKSLLALGDREEAKARLEEVAHGSDPQLAAQATHILRVARLR